MQIAYTRFVPKTDAAFDGGAESHICGAVRAAILQLRGIDSTQDFIERQTRALEHGTDRGDGDVGD